MTTPTLTLSDFLLDRIAEDEKQAADVHDTFKCNTLGHVAFPCDCGLPTRVLADCKAKRAIVDLHTVAHYCADDTLQDVVAPPYFGVAENVRTCPALLSLAQPYADHADFRDEWRA